MTAKAQRAASCRRSPPNPSSPRFVTVCVQGQPAGQYRSHERRLELLAKLAKEIDQCWKNLDAVVFPGGFLRLEESIGHLCYADRVRRLNAAGFVVPIKKAIKRLQNSPGALVTVGVDGPNYSNGDGGDQLCVATDIDGIVGIGRKIFPTDNEAHALLCCDTDFSEERRVVKLVSGRKAVLSACYDMFGVAERGNVNRARAKKIRWIGAYQDQIERGSRSFKDKLTTNLGAFKKVLDGVTVGIAAIHYFDGHSTGFWQRHGIAACSAALGSGFAVGAAHFVDGLPLKPNSSTLAAAEVPAKYLTQGIQRRANSWVPNDHFEFGEGTALVRFFSL